MGQRSAIVMFLIGGCILVPVALITVAGVLLGRAAIPVAFALLIIGVACLVTAKWPLIRNRQLVSFGSSQLSPHGRKLYWAAYTIIACGVLVAISAIPAH